MDWLPVLQILCRWAAGYRRLGVLTLPDKIRHREIAKIEISISLVLSDGVNVGHYGFYNAWWHDDAALIVEQYVMFSIAVVWPSDLTDLVKRPCHIGNVPSATNLSVCTLDIGNTLTELFDNFSTGA